MFLNQSEDPWSTGIESPDVILVKQKVSDLFSFQDLYKETEQKEEKEVIVQFVVLAFITHDWVYLVFCSQCFVGRLLK